MKFIVKYSSQTTIFNFFQPKSAQIYTSFILFHIETHNKNNFIELIWFEKYDNL